MGKHTFLHYIFTPMNGASEDQIHYLVQSLYGDKAVGSTRFGVICDYVLAVNKPVIEGNGKRLYELIVKVPENYQYWTSPFYETFQSSFSQERMTRSVDLPLRRLLCNAPPNISIVHASLNFTRYAKCLHFIDTNVSLKKQVDYLNIICNIRNAAYELLCGATVGNNIKGMDPYDMKLLNTYNLLYIIAE